MSSRFLSCLFLLVLFSSCQEEVYDVSDFKLSALEINELVIRDGVPENDVVLTIQVSGPDERDWRLNLGSNEGTVLSSVIRTGEVCEYILTDYIDIDTVDCFPFIIELRDPHTGDVLFYGSIEVPVRHEVAPGPVESVGISSVLVGFSPGIYSPLSLDGMDSVKVNVGKPFFVKVYYSPKDGNVDFDLAFSPSGPVLVDMMRKAGEYDCTLLCDKEYCGLLSILVSNHSSAFIVSFPVETVETPYIPPEEFVPTVNIGFPSVIFEEKRFEVYYDVSVQDLSEGYSFVLSVDGAFVAAGSLDALSGSIRVESAPQKGWHTLTFDLIDNKDKVIATSEEAFKVSDFSFEFVSYDGIRRNYLSYSKASQSGYLALSFGCDESEILSCTVTDRKTGVTLEEEGRGSFVYRVPFPGRGKRVYDVEVSTHAGVYSWKVLCEVRELWTCELLVEGNKTLYYVLSGPGAQFPCSFTARAGLWLEAFIQYDSAVIKDGKYVVESSYECSSIGYYSASMDIPYGTGSGSAVIVYSGKFGFLIDYIRKEAKKVPARSGGSSRWVVKDGLYTVEYFTPDVLPGAYVIVTSDRGALKRDYIEFEFDLSGVRSYFETRGIHYREYIY